MVHHQQLAFKDLFNNGDFERLQTLADATLQTDDGFKFKVHRMLLSYRNDYFSTLFCSDDTEKDQFTIHNMDAKLLDIILVYLYTGNISLTEENVADVLLASNRLLVHDLFSICQDFATGNINVNNCLQLFIAAWELEKLPLVNPCYRYVQVHFEEVIQKTGNTIGDIKLEALKKLLKDRNLNVTSEKVTWTAVVRWVEKNQFERLSFIPDLINCLYSEELETNVKTEILAHPLVKDNPYCKDLNSKYLNKSSEISLEHAKEHGKPKADTRTARIPVHVSIIAFYRVVDNSSHSVQLYLTYDDQMNIWRHVGEIDFWPDSLIRIQQKIYMFNALQDRRMAFDVLNGTFSQIRHMHIPRLHYHVILLEDRIYSLGGGTEQNEMTSIFECYNPATDSWSLLSSMIPMILSEAVAMDGRIFAIGEDDVFLRPEMTLQVYDPDSDSWAWISAPNVYRQQFASAVFEGHLFIIGGHDEFETLKNVEAYDPSSDAWKHMPILPFAYIVPKAVVLNKKLIVFENLYKSMSYGVAHPPVSWNQNVENWEVVGPESSLVDIHLYQFAIIEEQEILKELVAKNRLPNVRWVQSFLNLCSK